MNNDAEAYDGGAIYLLSFSQIVMRPGGHLNFVNNTGRYAVSTSICYYNVCMQECFWKA